MPFDLSIRTTITQELPIAKYCPVHLFVILMPCAPRCGLRKVSNTLLFTFLAQLPAGDLRSASVAQSVCWAFSPCDAIPLFFPLAPCPCHMVDAIAFGILRQRFVALNASPHCLALFAVFPLLLRRYHQDRGQTLHRLQPVRLYDPMIKMSSGCSMCRLQGW